MKVGIVCPYTWDVPGGVQQHIRDLAEALIELGHTVSVISPADEDTPLPDYVVPAGRAVPVPYNGSVARLAFGFLSASRVRRWVKEGNFDVLHVHEPAAPSLSLLACWVASGPIVATMHTANPKSRVMHAAGPALLTALEKINGRIAVSEVARTTLVEHLGGDAVLIPNGVATRRYAVAEPLPGWPGEGGAIGFLGRMDETRKGLGVLLKAFETLGTERPALRLLIAGRVTPARCWSGCPPRCATASCCSARSASRTRCGCCTRWMSSAPRTPAVRASASWSPRPWPRERRSWPATWTRSGGCCAAGRPASCSPPGTRPTSRGPPACCSTTRTAAPCCRPPRPAPSPRTTGPWWRGMCWPSTRPSCSAPPPWPWLT